MLDVAGVASPPRPPNVTWCPSPTHTQSIRTPQSIVIAALGVGTELGSGFAG